MLRTSLIFLLLSACASTPPRVSNSATKTTPYAVVEAARDLEGSTVGVLAASQDVTLAVFFATWCGHCRHELEVLKEMLDTDSRLRIVGINAYEEWGSMSDEKRLHSYLASHAPWLRVIRADESLMASFGRVKKIPTIFVFDKDGKLVISFRREVSGIPSKDALVRAIEKARAGKS